MLLQVKVAAKTMQWALLTVILLISCKVFAYQSLTDDGFDQFAEKLEKLQDASPQEAFDYLKQYIDNIEHLAIENQLTLYKIQAEIFSEIGLHQDSADVAQKALLLAKKLSSPSIVSAELYYSLGYAVENLGDYEAALKHYLKGVELSESLNDQKNIATGLINLGAIYYLKEEYDRSLIVLNQALNIGYSIEDLELLGYANTELGILYSYMGEDDKSMDYYQKSYEYYQQVGKAFYAYNALRNIASNHSINERYEESITVNKQIIENADKIGNADILSQSYASLAWAYLKKEDNNPELALKYLDIAEQYAQQSQMHDVDISMVTNRAFILYELKRFDEALTFALKAEKLLDEEQKVSNSLFKLDVLYLQAELFAELENYQQAFKKQSEFWKFAIEIRDRSNYEAVEDLRMRYESEQADLEKKILEQEKSVQVIRLKDAEYQERNRQIVIALAIIVVLVVSWFLIKIVRSQRRLVTVSYTDGLTGVINRRRLMELADLFYYQASKEGMAFSILMIDVDDFKQVNDNYGHKVGDKVLQKVAQIGSSIMRSSDEFGRFGGEEFIVLLPEANLQQSVEIAQRLCDSIESHEWPKMIEGGVSVSIGAASFDSTKHQSVDDIIKDADVLLYKAKSQGKNQVCH